MQVNDYIRFRYTGEKGKILKDFLDGSYKVLLLKDNEDIIAFQDDMVLEKNFKGIEKSQAIAEKGDKKIKKLSTEEMFFTKDELEQKKKKVLLQSTSTETSKPIQNHKQESENADFKQTALSIKTPKNSGLWLAFVPQSAVSYVVYLVNDSNFSLKFKFNFTNNDKSVVSLNQIIAPFDYFPVADFHNHLLNESPTFELNCSTYSLIENFRLKYKKWISMTAEIPIIGVNCPGHLLFSTDRISKASLNQSSNDLKAYTQSNLKNKQKAGSFGELLNEVQKVAAFSREIDLHAEKLITDVKNLSAAQIFEIQNNNLKKYMEQAINLKIDEVYIIHGLGEGILKKAVESHLATLLKDNLINDFKNEYHIGYGFGATRVKINI
jgi:hypothetical protein